MVVKTLSDFEGRFDYYYAQMYDGKLAEPYDMVVKGDNLISKSIKTEGKNSLVARFITYRQDPLTSDREVLAFYRTYMYFKKHGWTVGDGGPKSAHWQFR